MTNAPEWPTRARVDLFGVFVAPGSLLSVLCCCAVFVLFTLDTLVCLT